MPGCNWHDDITVGMLIYHGHWQCGLRKVWSPTPFNPHSPVHHEVRASALLHIPALGSVSPESNGFSEVQARPPQLSQSQPLLFHKFTVISSCFSNRKIAKEVGFVLPYMVSEENSKVIFILNSYR